MPCVIRIRAITIINGAAITAAPAARRILTLARDLLMGGLRLGLLGLIRPSCGAHVGGEHLFTRGPREIFVIHHGKNITRIPASVNPKLTHNWNFLL